MAGVSNGHSIAPGAWAIPLAALPSLQIMVPAGASGRAEVSITLVSIDGTVLAQTKTTLIVAQGDKVVTAEKAAAPQKPATARASAPPPAPPAATASILRTAPIPPGATSPEAKAPESLSAASTPEDRERALRLMKKGDDQMQEGNIAGARLFYERAADAGLAQAAMALAATYDASELSHVSRRGIQPDPTQARRWYERAKQLGAAEAAARLQRLGNN
jgi:TPR repeat protein